MNYLLCNINKNTISSDKKYKEEELISNLNDGKLVNDLLDYLNVWNEDKKGLSRIIIQSFTEENLAKICDLANESEGYMGFTICGLTHDELNPINNEDYILLKNAYEALTKIQYKGEYTSVEEKSPYYLFTLETKDGSYDYVVKSITKNLLFSYLLSNDIISLDKDQEKYKVHLNNKTLIKK